MITLWELQAKLLEHHARTFDGACNLCHCVHFVVTIGAHSSDF